MSFKKLLLSILWMCCAAKAFSQDDPVLNWCLDDYPGQHSFDGERIYGPTFDFMQALAKDSGFVLNPSEDTPFERCLNLMRKGETHLMMGLYDKDDRSEYMALLPVYSNLSERLFFNVGSRTTINSLQSLKGFRIAIRGDHPQHTLDYDYIAANNTIIPVVPLEHGLAMLMVNEVDFVLATDFAASGLINRNKRYMDAVRRHELKLAEDESTQIYLGISKTSGVSQTLQNRILLSIQTMQKEKRLRPLLFPDS